MIDEIEHSMLLELHQACRQVMRYNGVDADRLKSAYEHMTDIVHMINDYRNNCDYDELITDFDP